MLSAQARRKAARLTGIVGAVQDAVAVRADTVVSGIGEVTVKL
jgi:hypothetical protein